ncbi:DUF523 domain-containing protein [bacterium]|nr:DUF523 domain-containing protein [bacterium]
MPEEHRTNRPRAVISACLTGRACRYDGCDQYNPEVETLGEQYDLLPICPEVEGGLETPRPPAEITTGPGEAVLDGHARVVRVEDGGNVTGAFLKGARYTLQAAVETGASHAFLMDRSPSCGCERIYRNGVLVPGSGVTAALLKRNGLMVRSMSGKDQ